MKVIRTLCLTAFIIVNLDPLLIADHGAPIADYVVPIDWQRFDPDLSLDPNLQLAAEIMVNAAHYNAGWILKDLQLNPEGTMYAPHQMAEHGIRPIASAIYGLAVVLRTGIFDEDKVGVSHEELTSRVVKLIRGLAATHKVNSDPGGWGDHWQSALWAGLGGHGGWMIWDELDAETQSQLAKVVEHEANRFIVPEHKVPYWNGKGGNTQAEENAWDSMVLQVAATMMPEHPNAEGWKRICSKLMISAFSLESDMESDRVVDGKPVKEWLDGYNVREDGALINHSILHPDYMACTIQNMRSSIIRSLAGKSTPEAARFNVEILYDTWLNREFSSPPYREPGGTIYQPGKVELYYPNGNDWSYSRFDIYYVADSFAHVFGHDGSSGQKAGEWMKLRGERLLEMQARHEDRRVYAVGEFDRYPGREQLVAWQIGDGFMVQWLKAQNALSEEGNWLE